MIATVRGNGAGTSADSTAKERFVHHAAGYDGDGGGNGGGSYIDDVALRDRDDTNGWAGAADGTLEQRHYVFQNWRHDVVMVLKPNTEQVEQARYSSYGVPFGLPAADANSM